MFQRILVANRGEIALRVIRACRDLGIEVAVVYSEADRGASYLKLADRAVCIGPGPATESYLRVQRIIAAAESVGADAIHPGYGFLSENADFAHICRECKIEFIGPPEEAMRQVGNKDRAKHLAKYVEQPRHIEVQVLADKHGNVVHLFERDCSLQRRHQKLVEESPAPNLPDRTRRDICDAAVRLVKAASYYNAGTCEFLLDKDNNFFFIEVNARIQVEHPVTELVTGIDLIREQIRVAAGEKLRFAQRDIVQRGSAIECRINAEDPSQDFRPCPG